ncbi:MAG TPA: hypothetical protein PKA58_17275 [Polyangium sp.]|nr:hypothetical protein [Polyangium sp.]
MPPVGRVDITAADAVGSAPITSIELPDNGGKPLAEDWQNVAAMALANDAYRATAISGKVAKAGDTMTGLLTANAGITVASGQDLTLNGVSVQGTVGFSTLGQVWLAGRKRFYRARVTLSDASQDVTVDQGDRFVCPAANAAPRTITLKSTGTVPDAGETLTFFWNPGTGGGTGTQYTFQREGGTVVATFVGAQVADTGAVFAEFEYTSGGWKLGQHSGTPNEYTSGPDTWTSYGVIPGAGA